MAIAWNLGAEQIVLFCMCWGSLTLGNLSTTYTDFHGDYIFCQQFRRKSSLRYSRCWNGVVLPMTGFGELSTAMVYLSHELQLFKSLMMGLPLRKLGVYMVFCFPAVNVFISNWMKTQQKTKNYFLFGDTMDLWGWLHYTGLAMCQNSFAWFQSQAQRAHDVAHGVPRIIILNLSHSHPVQLQTNFLWRGVTGPSNFSWLHTNVDWIYPT